MKIRLRTFLLVMVCALGMQSLHAKKILGDLDFTSGSWVMIGVSLHNYHPLPIQQEVGTFIVKEPVILKKIQEKWDFEEKFDDYCDFHYAIKFYKNGELQTTLRVNLLCNYITLGGFSYEYNTSMFEEFKMYYTPIKWSRIRFQRMEKMQASIPVLDKAPGVYWYGDVQQYNFSGHFMTREDHLPWNADRDSAANAYTERLREELGREDFYVEVYAWYLSDDWEEMSIRYNVYCHEDFARKYKGEDKMISWRSHLSEQNFVQIVVIGMNREDYYRYMAEAGM